MIEHRNGRRVRMNERAEIDHAQALKDDRKQQLKLFKLKLLRKGKI